MGNDYKDTLNLPETSFPMKANLPEREPGALKFWEEKDVYGKMLEKNKGKDGYVLHDGPPYANGHIHIGHALNKVLKDIIVKYKAMRGFYSPYVPGWDCHGLPIENEVDKKLGKKKGEVGILEKRLLCRKYAEEFVDIQREEFKRLGGLGDWGNPYLTMTKGYEGSIIRELMEFVKSGHAYKGKKPVYWCPSCVTALAEAEVEYADKESPSVFVKFKLNAEDASNRLKLVGKDAYIVIWTTTPWTLPANLALAVNPDVEYAAVGGPEGVVYILARELYDALKEKLSLDEILFTFKGKDLLGMKAQHPFIDRQSTVIPGDFVTTEEGTGIVHIAPGHGEDDYVAGLKEGLEIYAPVDDRGKFKDAGVPDIEGMFVFDANKKIIEIMTENGSLLNEEKYKHSYPHCWRCKKPVIFRATEQWFISMEHAGLREKCLDEIERVKWVPEWGKDRIKGMVTTRPDWCISRQRSWGVPIAVFRCSKCGEILRDKEVLDSVVRLFEEKGSDAWFTPPTPPLAKGGTEGGVSFLEGKKCPKCGNADFTKEKDILDVWFESGVSHAAVLLSGAYPGIAGSRSAWPADMYLEGSDQHRGWFQSSLLASVGTRGKAPYKTVLTHGFVVDGQGKKMSKSLGNVVAPQEIIKSTGAEILRLWVSAEDYRGDIRISKEIIARLTEAYRKIRNTARFLLGNLNDYTPTPPSPPLGKGGIIGGYEIDRWAMSRLQGLIEDVTRAYENYDFHMVYHRLYNFCVVDMSSFYLDILKDRLYTFRKDSPERRAAQRVLNEILHTMTKLMAPVLSFTAEEIWQTIRGNSTESAKGEGPMAPESVFLSDFPEVRKEFVDKALEEKWQRLIDIRTEVNKALELKRAEKFIGNSLEAKVVLYPKGDDVALLLEQKDFLPALFIVSQAEIRESGEGEYKSEALPGLSNSVQKADGHKCARCWNYSTLVGTFTDEPEVCGRCHSTLKEGR